MSERLLPCPFCGGEAKILYLVNMDMPMYWPRCKVCDAEINTLFRSAELAIEAWNRRTQE